ncbi:MAG: DUF2905 domain-containing protein [Anaerolineae bacterium]|nr:DUF2905 domain-containing protein [Anaerolineae bacterium]
MDLSSAGRLLLFAGALLIAAGLLFIALGRIPGLRLGHLPGDIRVERSGFSCFFPLATMIILSLVLTLALNLLIRLINR